MERCIRGLSTEDSPILKMWGSCSQAETFQKPSCAHCLKTSSSMYDLAHSISSGNPVGRLFCVSFLQQPSAQESLAQVDCVSATNILIGFVLILDTLLIVCYTQKPARKLAKTKEQLTKEETEQIEYENASYGLENGEFYDGYRFRDLNGMMLPHHPSKLDQIQINFSVYAAFDYTQPRATRASHICRRYVSKPHPPPPTDQLLAY